MQEINAKLVCCKSQYTKTYEDIIMTLNSLRKLKYKICENYVLLVLFTIRDAVWRYFSNS